MNRNQLLHYAIRYRGDYVAIQRALERSEPYEVPLSDIRAVTIAESEYPQRLRDLKQAPFVLFFRGNWSLIHEPGIAIVGSRKICPYAHQMTVWITSQLAKRYVVISGMASGVDAVAHQTSLSVGRSIAVLGCGIDRIYPPENTALYHQLIENGLVISEYPEKTSPLQHHFPWRNRIVSALCRCVIVTQADYKSGSMITVRHALTLGRDVATIPYRITDKEGEACNALVRDGAQLILDSVDLDLI